MPFFGMHSAAERVHIILFSLMVLGFGSLSLNQYLNHLNEPAIALSNLVIGESIGLMGWEWTLPAGRRYR